MDLTKVFLIHLRRPKGKKEDPNERRDDPFYEFGSFGCTGCHSSTLFDPRHAADLEGARLTFIQGGLLGHRLVYLTPPIAVQVWSNRCEARWTPGEMPFKYTEAPTLARNGAASDFPLVEDFALSTECKTVESGLSSKFRSRVRALSAEMAAEVIAEYERRQDTAGPAAFARTYGEALPWCPPMLDRDRGGTYERLLHNLRNGVKATEVDGAALAVMDQPRRGRSPCETARRKGAC